jgi:hypothetical protein
MSWPTFLDALCNRKEYGLTLLEKEVIMCLEENLAKTKYELFQSYKNSCSNIEEEAFTQRLKNIYKKFNITGRGQKLPQLYNHISEEYSKYKNKDIFFSEVGLTYIYPRFPREAFENEIEKVISETCQSNRVIDILQTFAPNLQDYTEHLIRCIQNGVKIRVLLAWPYSEAAKLREEVLRKYALDSSNSEINIQDKVIENLEILEKILTCVSENNLLEIRLYDTLPSLAIYRAGQYILAGVFLHGELAINTFQFELNLAAPNDFIAKTLRNDFELMWKVARKFSPDRSSNWRNDLKILFNDINKYA